MPQKVLIFLHQVQVVFWGESFPHGVLVDFFAGMRFFPHNIHILEYTNIIYSFMCKQWISTMCMIYTYVYDIYTNTKYLRYFPLIFDEVGNGVKSWRCKYKIVEMHPFKNY